MILDFPFKQKVNHAKFEFEIDLNRLRKYHKIAELEASMLESIDENPAHCVDDFIMSFDIPDRMSLSNLKNQIIKLKKEEIDQIHINNMIYLTVNINKFEQLVFKDHWNKFSEIKKDIVSMLHVANAINIGRVNEVKISLYSDLHNLAGIGFDTNVISNVLLPILKEGVVRLTEEYYPLLKRIIGTAYDLKNLTNDDLKFIINDIDKYIFANTSRGFKRYRLDLLLLYIRDNDVFKRKKNINYTYPNSAEARLLYFILCVTGSREVMLVAPKLEKPKDGKLGNQNDRIINQIIREYSKHKSPIASIAMDDSRIFEYYCASLLK